MADETLNTGIFLLATPADFVPIEAPLFEFRYLGTEIVPEPDLPADPIAGDPADPTPVPPDPYMLFGTDGADRFALDAGYDQGYTVVNFEPGKDVIVIDGTSAGVPKDALDNPLALTADAIDGFFYDRDTGMLSVSDALGVQFADNVGTASPVLTASDFEIV